jgi:hypothetical protein
MMNPSPNTHFRPASTRALGLAASLLTSLGSEIPLTPIEELARRAEIVARGRVASLEARRDDTGRAFTRVELDVMETWKGPETNRLVVVQGSAVLGSRQVRVLGEPVFRLGEAVVLFGVFNPRGEAVTLDLARGKFSVTTNTRSLALVATSDGARVAGGVALPGQAPVELTELKRRVQEVQP